MRLSVSCDGCRDGWLSCSHTVPVPVLERDIVARLRRYADVEVPTVLMDVLPWYAVGREHGEEFKREARSISE